MLRSRPEPTGLIFALLYYAIFSAIDESGWWLGAVFDLHHGFFSATARLHPTPSSVTKDQRRTRQISGMQIDPRQPRRRLHLEHSHPRVLAASIA